MLVAGGTFYLALTTRSLSREARRQAEATEDLAREARLDRELSIGPFLRFKVISHVAKPSGPPGVPSLGYSHIVSLSNIGNGPAWHCVYLGRHPVRTAEWCWTILPELKANDTSAELIADPGPNNVPIELFDPGPGAAPFYSVVYCKDILGNRLRFAPNRESRDISGPNDPVPPPWARSELL